MKTTVFLLALLPLSALGAPFVVSDSTTQIVTHCGVVLDTAVKVDVPVVTDLTGKLCKYDLTAVSSGVHTLKVTFVNIDPIWGRSESALSIPFTFTRPSPTITVSPAGLVITPF